MSQPENYIAYRLMSDPVVVQHCGFRIFSMFVPKTDGDFPFVVYKRSNTARDTTITHHSAIGLPLLSIQVSTWATDADQARLVGDRVRMVLDGNTGDAAGCTITDIRLTSETDDFVEPTGAGAQMPLAYEVRQLFQIRWGEPVTL